ncbi:MAG: hypothetical protein JWN89_93 [Parcubacteria group bacterium]|nr:hypothetical protein [Parcubacteria group bacterium]
MKISTFIRIVLVSLFVVVPMRRTMALTVSPAKIEISADPGTTVSGEFLVVNEEGGIKTFYTSSENFEAQGETGTPSFVPGEKDLASWTKVISEVTLGKGEQRKIPFTISVPNGAEAGGHFAAIFLSTIPPANSSNQVSVGSKIGILLLLRVSGPLKEGGGLLEFSTENNKHFYTSLPVLFSYRFQNSGNDRVKPNGTLKIKNSLWLTSYEGSGNPSEGNILPGSVRKFSLEWKKNETSGDPVGFMGALKNEWKNFAFGFYTAHLDLQYGSTPDTASLSTTFFVLPWHVLLIGLGILIVLLFIFSRIVKRYNRWIIEKSRSAL